MIRDREIQIKVKNLTSAYSSDHNQLLTPETLETRWDQRVATISAVYRVYNN